MSRVLTAPTISPELTDDDDGDYCHLLDDEQRALCFADISGRAVHWAMFDGSVCIGCGRVQCQKCVRIRAVMPRSA